MVKEAFVSKSKDKLVAKKRKIGIGLYEDDDAVVWSLSRAENGDWMIFRAAGEMVKYANSWRGRWDYEVKKKPFKIRSKRAFVDEELFELDIDGKVVQIRREPVYGNWLLIVDDEVQPFPDDVSDLLEDVENPLDRMEVWMELTRTDGFMHFVNEVLEERV